ncbi:MAG TPA: hypothetical protein PLM08_20455, partial [Polyangiaceae bacterium]|nr:hypothetical protein [Polyangiaceae bacterium]
EVFMAVRRNNFVIAGLGSSGTLFLAQRMNQSQIWQVVHTGVRHRVDLDEASSKPEHSIPMTLPSLSEAQAGYDAHPRNFGDINGVMLFHLLELQVGRKAVIIRNPRDTLLSWYCHAKGALPGAFFPIYASGYFALEECLTAGLPCIRFERMVRDADYLRRVFRYFGILDVTPTPATLGSKINSKRSVFCPSYEAIDRVTRERFDRAVGGFASKYYGDGPLLHDDDFKGVGEQGLGDPDGPEVEESVFAKQDLNPGSSFEKPDSLATEALTRLASRLTLNPPGATGAEPRLVHAQVFEDRLVLHISSDAQESDRIVIERRKDGVPYYLRTRYLHLSYVGSTSSSGLQATFDVLVRQLGDTRFEQLMVEVEPSGPHGG